VCDCSEYESSETAATPLAVLCVCNCSEYESCDM